MGIWDTWQKFVFKKQFRKLWLPFLRALLHTRKQKNAKNAPKTLRDGAGRLHWMRF